MIETRLLQYFLAVAEEQSITKAAEYLHISQPTLSKQMMDLETALGKQLLVRGRKKVTLTEEGMYLRSRAREIIDLVENTEASFRDCEELITGDVFIGCGEHRTSFFIMQMIRDIQKNYPGITFHFFSSNADAIIERLDKGLLDVGILLEPEINPRYNFQKLPYQEVWGVLMRKDSPLSSKKFLTLKETAALPLILPDQTSNKNRTTTFFIDELAASHVTATYNLIYNAGLMVESGMGYAVCIDGLINTSGDHPLVFLPFSPPVRSHVYLFSKKYQVFSKATKLFLTRLQQKILQLSPQ